MGFRYAVLGSGRQGTAAAYDLALLGNAEYILLADMSLAQAERSATRVNSLVGREVARAAQVDVQDEDAVVALLAGASIQVGGTVGSLLLAGWLQRQRFFAIAILFVLAVPVVGSIGFAGLTSQLALLTATFFAGFLVLGIQIGINVVGAMLYPTSLRANGSGWQLGLGRLGSIVGPLAGALFVGMPVQELYMWSALPFAGGAVVSFAIHFLNTARLRAHPELAKAQ